MSQEDKVMCRVIAVSNQKGGVGKTTTSINLGVGLARMGQRVLLVDSDPQGHLTLGLGFPKNIRVTLKNMMENIIMVIEFDPKEAVLHHKEGVTWFRPINCSRVWTCLCLRWMIGKRF